MHLFVSFILRAVAVFTKDAVLFADETMDHCLMSTVLNSPSLSPLAGHLILYLKATGRPLHPISPIAKTEIFKQTILCKPKDQVLRLYSALIFRSVDSNEALTISTSKEFNTWKKKPQYFPFKNLN